VLPVLAAYDPGAQGVQAPRPVLLALDPTAHGWQDVLPGVAANDPAAHGRQLLDSALGCAMPSGQASQVAWPVRGCDVPGAQGTQVVWPVIGWEKPMAQGVQTIEPCTLLKEPAGQGKHPLPVGLYWPTGHPIAAAVPHRAASAPPTSPVATQRPNARREPACTTSRASRSNRTSSIDFLLQGNPHQAWLKRGITTVQSRTSSGDQGSALQAPSTHSPSHHTILLSHSTGPTRRAHLSKVIFRGPSRRQGQMSPSQCWRNTTFDRRARETSSID
jgi:hypothetical protein